MIQYITSLYTAHPTLCIWWIVIGLIVGFWTFIEYIHDCYYGDSVMELWESFRIVLIGILFYCIDIVVWPLYILAKLSEWFWIFRRR